MDYPLVVDSYAETHLLREITSKLTQITTPGEWLEAVSLYPRQRGAKAGYLLWLQSEVDDYPLQAEVAASWLLDDGPHAGEGALVALPTFWQDHDPWYAAPEQPVLIEDVLTSQLLDTSTREYYTHNQARAVAILPLMVKGHCVGLLTFYWRNPITFDARDRRIYSASIQLSRPVIESMQLDRLYTRRATQVDIISDALSQAANEAEILRAITQFAHLYGAQGAVLLYLYCDRDGCPQEAQNSTISASGTSWPYFADRRHITPGIYNALMPRRLPASKPHFIENVETDSGLDDADRAVLLAGDARAVVLLPLRSAGKWHAMILVHWPSPRAFTEDERAVYGAILPTTAAVVARRRVYLENGINEQTAASLFRLAGLINAATTYQEIVDSIALLPLCSDGVLLNFFEHMDYARATYIETVAVGAVPDEVRLRLQPRIPRLRVIEKMQHETLWICENIYTDPRFDPETLAIYERLPTRAFMIVPLRTGDRLWGLILLNNAKPRTFSDRERQLALGIGDLVTAAVERIRLLQETAAAVEAQRKALLAEQEARAETSLLYQASEAVNAATTFPEVIRAIEPLARQIERVHLILWEHLDYRKATYFEIAAGIDHLGKTPPTVGERYAETQYPMASQLATLHQLVIEDIADHPLVDPVTRENWQAANMQALMLISLIQDGRWYGVLSFESTTPRRYSESERRLTLAISDLVLSAIIRIQAQYELAAAADAQRSAFLAEQALGQEIALLYQVSKAINQATAMSEVLEASKQLFPDPVHVAIFAWEHYDRSRASYLESIISTDPNLPSGFRLPREIVYGPTSLEPMQILAANDVHSPEWANHPGTESARMFGLYSIAFTNLLHSQRVQGLFAIGCYVPYTFTPQEIRLMSAIADLTAAALERFRSRQAEEDAREERELLFQASQAINAANSFHEILEAAAHIDFDGGVYYLYIFENFDHKTATYIETVATGENRFMHMGMRIPLDELPFLKNHPRPGLWAYEDVPNHPELDPITKATMTGSGVISNLRFGLVWHNRILGAFGIDHATPKRYSEREKRMMTALGEMVSAAVERIRLQQETHAARERAERLAEQAQQLAALEERTRLARELHDSVSQALYGIGLGAQTARRFLDDDPALARESIDYILALAEAGLAEMRALIFELRPESLENEGLAVALAKQGASLQARHGIAVQLELCDEPSLALATKESLYRVAREALHNVVKHACATQITLRMRCDNHAFQLDVIDNGIGFETNRDFPGHLGLRSMRERVAQLGGTFTITSASGQGTHLSVMVPPEAS